MENNFIVIEDNNFVIVDQLHGQSDFFINSIRAKAVEALTFPPVLSFLLILRWLYIVTLGRFFEPVKYALYRRTYAAVQLECKRVGLF